MKMIAGFGVAAAMTLMLGCAGSPVRPTEAAVALTSEQWDGWSAAYKAALSAANTAKTPAQISLAVDGLAEVALKAPTMESRQMAERDACLVSAAAGDGAALQQLGCEDGALKGLIGGK